MRETNHAVRASAIGNCFMTRIGRTRPKDKENEIRYEPNDDDDDVLIREIETSKARKAAG